MTTQQVIQKLGQQLSIDLLSRLDSAKNESDAHDVVLDMIDHYDFHYNDPLGFNRMSQNLYETFMDDQWQPQDQLFNIWSEFHDYRTKSNDELESCIVQFLNENL